MFKSGYTPYILVTLFVLFISCTSDQERLNEFEKELSAGNLTKAEQLLKEFSDTREGEKAAGELIQTYLSVDQIDKAVYVYENITSNHRDRYEISSPFVKDDDYSKSMCRILREYMVSHGYYDRAWQYYPISYNSDDYYGNAEDRYQYLSDVINDMCLKGKQEAAMRFIQLQVAWYVAHVDPNIEENPELASFSSNNVRQKLLEQMNALSW